MVVFLFPGFLKHVMCREEAPKLVYIISRRVRVKQGLTYIHTGLSTSFPETNCMDIKQMYVCIVLQKWEACELSAGKIEMSYFYCCIIQGVQ